MSSVQDRIVMACLLLAESAWLFAIFGVFGIMLSGGGSPLTWLAILAVMSCSMLIVRTLQRIIMPVVVAYAIQMVAGVLVIYFTVGSQVSPTFQGLDLGWLGTLASGGGEENYPFRAVMGSLFGAYLWWRGGHIGSSEFPEETLTTSFKVGILILAVSTLVDLFHPADLRTFPMMFLFFAASLTGLSIAHIMPASVQATAERAWIRVVGSVTAIVLVLGLLFSLLQRNVLSVIATPIMFVLNLMAMVVFFVIIVPLAYIVNFLTQLIFGLLASLGEPQEQPEILTAPGSLAEQLQAMQQNGENPVAATILMIGQWAIVAIIIGIALLVLALAFQRKYRSRRRAQDSTRESLREDADPAYDFAKLFLKLLPSRLRRSKQGLRYRLPQDEQGVVDVFRVYFGMLTIAADKGELKPDGQTPREYQGVLEGLFPQRLVRMATAAFVRACYGRYPATPEQIDEMRTSLEQSASELK